MSTHPNVILLLILTPDDGSRKTHRAIMAECGITDPDNDIKIGDHTVSHKVMEEDYDEDMQISAPEGSIILHRFLTYGYGETVAWSDLLKAKDELAEWSQGICERHRCSGEILITANYW